MIIILLFLKLCIIVTHMSYILIKKLQFPSNKIPHLIKHNYKEWNDHLYNYILNILKCKRGRIMQPIVIGALQKNILIKSEAV